MVINLHKKLISYLKLKFKLKMAELTNLQQECDEAYNNGDPLITDEEYDAIFGDNTAHHNLKGFNAELPIWMGSLDKKRNRKSLNAWLNKKSNNFVISAKLDGISALYDPHRNKLYTRGNGKLGTDISRFINYLDMTKISPQVENKVLIRGELIMSTDIFNKKYKQCFKNSRNLVSGQFSKNIINEEIIKDINFIPYEFIYTQSKQLPISEQLSLLGIWSFPRKTTEPFHSSVKRLKQNSLLPWFKTNKNEITQDFLIKILDKWTKDCIFAIDGLVVTEDCLYERNIKDNPKYAIAFKREVDIESCLSTVTDITWEVSRWGLIKPVVNIEPVNISGVTISKCTGHNAKYIVDNKIGNGAQIICVRSGDVIPKIISVVKPSDNINLPVNTWKGVDLYTDQETDTVEIKTLTNVFSSIDVKYVNTKTVEKMYNTCGLNTFIKMLNCTQEDLEPVFKQKSATRIISEIQALKSRSLKLHVLVGASGVLGYGLGAKRVESLFSSLPTLRNKDFKTVPTMEEVCKVEGFAQKMAEKVVNNFPMLANFIEICLQNGLSFDEWNTDENITGGHKTKICLSGFRDKTLEMKYEVLSSVTKQCDLLVCKSFEKETLKIIKAKELGIKIILLQDLQ
jgi:DNA ligase (NAD+)